MNEFDFIGEMLRPLADSEGAAGLLDDVAVLKSFARPSVITTDTIVEGRHFRAGDPWGTIGRKLVRVNVSDCYAKAALPRLCLFNLTWNDAYGRDALVALITGLKADLSQYNIALIGGDTTAHHGPAVLSMTMIGECVREDGPVRRLTGRAGDDLWVSGTIGDAGLGLKLAEPGTDAEQWLNSAYLVPNLPPESIADLVEEFASAAMDVSDGLIVDCQRLAATSGRGVELDLTQLPVSAQAREKLGLDLGDEALLSLASAGDDYQVLFAASAAVRNDVIASAEQNGVALTRVGSLLAEGGFRCLGNAGNPIEVLKPGWEHQLFL